MVYVGKISLAAKFFVFVVVVILTVVLGESLFACVTHIKGEQKRKRKTKMIAVNIHKNIL